jgi:K+-sensing histidine kinase KdpD
VGGTDCRNETNLPVGGISLATFGASGNSREHLGQTMNHWRPNDHVRRVRSTDATNRPPYAPGPLTDPVGQDFGLINGLDSVLSLLIHSGKNHLGPIKGFASLIQDDSDEESNVRHWVDKIMRNVRELEAQIDFLDMFRLNGSVGVAEINWHRVVNAVMDQYAAVNVRGVPIEIVNEVRGDFFQHIELLKRVLVHLVVNAYESIHKTGKITLAITERSNESDDRRRFAVWITDTGCGITGEEMERVWAPFYTTKSHHLGLGLPYVAAAASIMEMDIEVASVDGQGTTVGLILAEQGG